MRVVRVESMVRVVRVPSVVSEVSDVMRVVRVEEGGMVSGERDMMRVVRVERVESGEDGVCSLCVCVCVCNTKLTLHSQLSGHSCYQPLELPICEYCGPVMGGSVGV